MIVYQRFVQFDTDYSGWVDISEKEYKYLKEIYSDDKVTTRKICVIEDL